MDNSPWTRSRKLKFISIMRKVCSMESYIPKGTLIYCQEDQAGFLHFLYQGRIKIYINNANGREKTLAIEESGNFFGETSFFNESIYFANAVALVDSVIMRFSRVQVNNMISSNPDMAVFFIKHLGQKVVQLSYQVEYLSLLNIEKRVVALLMSIMKVKGTPWQGDGMYLNIHITDQELGNMLGIRREAVTKALSRLKALNLLQKNNHLFFSPSLKTLEDFLDSEP